METKIGKFFHSRIHYQESDRHNVEMQPLLKDLSSHTSNLEQYLAQLGTSQDKKAFRESLKQEWDGSTLLAKQLISHNQFQQSDIKLTNALEKEFKRYQAVRKKIEEKQKAIICSMQEDLEDLDHQDTHLQREIQERNRLVKEIESDSLLILDLYKEVKTLVEFQREQLLVTEENITQAHESVKKGIPELEEADKDQKSDQKKQCCLIGVMIVCVVFLVLFLYFTISK